MLQNTEINSRASIYLNLAHVFLIGFFPDEWAWFTQRVGIEIELGKNLGLDVAGNYEVIEFPTGTAATSVTGGVFYRI